MTTRLFLQVLLVNCFIIVGVNFLMIVPEFKSFVLDKDHRIVSTLAIYGVQFFVTWYLLRAHSNWLFQPYNWKALLQGLVGFAIVMLMCNILVLKLTNHQGAISSWENLAAFLPIFLLNSIPGALAEEWLFRYFPVRFSHMDFFKLNPALFFLSMILLFTLIHIPAYLFQYDYSMSSLGNVFVSGLLMLLIFLMTKNVLFVALYHAFGNKPFFAFDSQFNWTYFYASVFLVSMLWALLDYKFGRKLLT